MEKWDINNDVLEYDDATHTYYVNGVIVPSVTQIVAFAYPSTYKDIDPGILKRASELGTKMHKEIEDYEYNLEEPNVCSPELDGYIKLKKYFGWNVIVCEQPVIIYNDNVPICVGRIDQVIDLCDEIVINDLKRTKEVHQDRLSLQLSLYALGYEQNCCDGMTINKGYCTHLRKDVAEFIEIKLDKNKAIEKCLEYAKQIDDGDEFEW